MKSIRTLVVAVGLVLGLAAVSGANALEKRHGVGLRLGMWNMNTDARIEVLDPSVSTSVGGDGLLGGVAYNHWLTESVALDISVSALTADFDTRVGILSVSTETSTVTSVLFGMKLYFPVSTYGTTVRPFFKGAVGPFMGSQSATVVALSVVSESRSENAFGGQLGGGVDFILGRHFLLGVNLGYNMMTDFDQPIGGSDNYSGPEFGIGLNYLFGRGVSKE